MSEKRTPLEVEFEEIITLDKSVFSEQDIIPKEIFIQWYRTNPNTFVVLSVKGVIVGYYSILPLKAKPMTRFLKGEICESDFKPTDILTAKNAKNASNLYFFSIVADKNNQNAAGYQLILDARAHIKELYPLAKKVYAAVAATNGKEISSSDGTRLLIGHHFKKVADHSRRIDNHDLYELSR